MINQTLSFKVICNVLEHFLKPSKKCVCLCRKWWFSLIASFKKNPRQEKIHAGYNKELNLLNINPFQVIGPFLFHLKRSEDLLFSNIVKGNKKVNISLKE